MASQITSLTIVYRLFKAQIKEKIKASGHWPLWGEFTGEYWRRKIIDHILNP